MHTNIVLIDFENVQPESLTALEHDHFKIIVFVGANQTKVPFELADALQRMGKKAEYVKISNNGKDALDFHIAFYIGNLTAQYPSSYFHIISKDSGFDPLIQHLKLKKIFCSRSVSIDDIPLVKAANRTTPAKRVDLIIEKLSQPKISRPRAIKTLSNAIAAFFQKQITEPEINNIIAAMQKKGFIEVNDNKVSYTT